MNKPLILYTAFTKAVDNYNERHHFTRGHLADALGFVGANAANQLSNALNPLNHDKTLNDEKKYKLLHTLERDDVMIFFTHYMKQFGLKPALISTPKVTYISLHCAADNAMMEADEAFRATKLSLRDKTLTQKELEDIVRENSEAEEAHALTRRLAEKRLEEMKEAL